MKKTTIIFIISLLSLLITNSVIASVPPPLAPDKKEADKFILIISSYREEVEWSTALANTIKTEINDKHPELDVYIDYLNADIARNLSAMTITMRTIFRSIANHSSTSINPLDLNINTLFKDINEYPEAVLLIGEEAWINYRAYFALMGNWKNVPVMLIGVNELVPSEDWIPTKEIDWNKMEPVSTRQQSMILSPGYPFPIASDLSIKTLKNGEKVVSHDFDLTGIRYAPMAKELLKEISLLIPDLNEILFVDNAYYNSQYANKQIQEEITNNYPRVDYKTLFCTDSNMDVIYNEMLSFKPGRAIITNGFKIDPVNSRKTAEYLNYQFETTQTTPIFSLKPQYSSNNYMVGGVYPSTDEALYNISAGIERILSGAKASDIPFVTIESAVTALNKAALSRYHLADNAKQLQDVVYYNTPPSFFRRYERQIFYITIILFFLLGYIVLSIRRSAYIKRQKNDSLRYQRLYKELQLIYGHSHIDFAIYHKGGNCAVKIINEKDDNSKSIVAKKLLTENIYASTYISKELKEQLHKGVNTEITIHSKSGGKQEKHIYQLIVKPLEQKNTASTSYSYMVLVINLTSLLHEKDEKKRIESLLDYASDSFQIGVAYYNLVTRKGTANQSWYANLNETARATLEPTYANINGQDRIQLWDYIAKMEKGEVAPFERDIRVVGEDKLEHWIRQNIFQLKFDPENNDIQVVELNINIDQQKQSETILREAKKKAEIANKEAEEFLASISHEVRTPLNAIVGFSSVIAECDDPDETKELGSIVKKNNVLIKQLITDILELSQFDSGNVSFQYSNILLNEFMESLKHYAQSNLLLNKQLKVKCDLPTMENVVTTDVHYFKHLIIHLVSNAVKFTDEGTITLGYYKKENYFYFFVEDTGKGIPEGKEELVFKRFEKIDTFAQGSGLGLSLCKSIVTKMGGEIGVSSKEGKGSRFWFILPEEG